MRLQLHDASVLIATTSSARNPVSQTLTVLSSTQYCSSLLMRVPDRVGMNAVINL